jgi:RHS repeat-associated protein
MAFAENTTAEQGLQPYKYNGKELDQMHGLNMYDYSARFYEPGIGRFSTVDPLAEKYYSISPYAYCLNNPIKLIDKDGRDPSNPEHWKRFGMDLIKSTKIALSVGLQLAGSAKLAGIGTTANLNALSIDLVGLKDGVLFHPGDNFDKSEIKKEAEVTAGVVTGGVSSIVKNDENKQTVLEETIKGGLGPFELQHVETTPLGRNFEKVGSPKKETEVRAADAEFKLKAIIGIEIEFDFNKGWEALKKLVHDK